MQHTLNVQGMTCGHCEKAVTKAIQALDATAQVSIDRPAGKVEVVTALPLEQLKKAVVEEGYAVN